VVVLARGVDDRRTLGDEMAVPREQGVRAHDGFDLLAHAAPHALRLGSQTDALGIGEPETTRTELLSKDTILGLQILNHLALLLVDPAGQSDEEEPQWRRNGIIQGSLSERAHGVIQVAQVVTLNGLGQTRSLDRISRTERGR
jgi:hypothetical protein